MCIRDRDVTVVPEETELSDDVPTVSPEEAEVLSDREDSKAVVLSEPNARQEGSRRAPVSIRENRECFFFISNPPLIVKCFCGIKENDLAVLIDHV